MIVCKTSMREMPDTCDQCLFYLSFPENTGEGLQTLVPMCTMSADGFSPREITGAGKRMEWCPLREMLGDDLVALMEDDGK